MSSIPCPKDKSNSRWNANLSPYKIAVWSSTTWAATILSIFVCSCHFPSSSFERSTRNRRFKSWKKFSANSLPWHSVIKKVPPGKVLLPLSTLLFFTLSLSPSLPFNQPLCLHTLQLVFLFLSLFCFLSFLALFSFFSRSPFNPLCPLVSFLLFLSLLSPFLSFYQCYSF